MVPDHYIFCHLYVLRIWEVSRGGGIRLRWVHHSEISVTLVLTPLTSLAFEIAEVFIHWLSCLFPPLQIHPADNQLTVISLDFQYHVGVRSLYFLFIVLHIWEVSLSCLCSVVCTVVHICHITLKLDPFLKHNISRGSHNNFLPAYNWGVPDKGCYFSSNTDW